MIRSLLVAVCLLASAATAHAECASNLWRTDTTTTPPDIGPYVASAYPTVQECDTALAEEFRQLKVGGWDPHYVTARTIIGFQGRGTEAIRSRHYRCLPSDTDPRDVKGK
jgi:hypothetical protein